MKPSPKIVLIILSIFYSQLSFSQPQRGDFRILFYNVENLFDILDDSLTSDEEFLPDQGRFWTYKRFQNKLTNISKVIVASGGWEAPEIVGLCEVENRYVVEQLVKCTPLQKINYKIIHKESPDERGIDVSFIYNSERFNPIKYEYIPIYDKNSLPVTTREILYVKGVPVYTTDTIHLFVNHWPSRYGGSLETVELRNQAAKTLKFVVDKLFLESINPKIIIIGDFNDQPTDISISEILMAESKTSDNTGDKLINLASEWKSTDIGTIKYQLQWLVYDQIIVSENLLISDKGISCKKNDAHIFRNEFLLEKDRTYSGYKPFRTFSGFNYNGGFSDHLPVYLDLFFR